MSVSKGTISALHDDGKTAEVKPYMGNVVTPRLVVPFFLVGSLEVEMPVVYAAFEDNTGVVLARMDGEWNRDLEGSVNVQGDISTGSVGSVNAHIHNCPDGSTSGPV